MSSTNDPDSTPLRRTTTMNPVEFEEVMLSTGEDTVTVIRAKPTPPPPSIGLLIRSTTSPPSPPPQIGYPLGQSVPRTGLQMDEPNAKALEIMKTEGGEASVKHMFTREDGSTRSYSEMRMMYG